MQIDLRRADGRPVVSATWRMAAFGTRSETPLAYDKETRERLNRRFPRDSAATRTA